MPSPRPARKIVRNRVCRSTLRRRRNRAWLTKRLVEKISGIADQILRKREEGLAAAQTDAPHCYPPSGPASREDPCEAAANTPSMPR
jgi:hypothetical protein